MDVTEGMSLWTVFAVASIPAAASIVAAVVAGRSALRSRKLETEAQHVRDLEARLAERKRKMYQPMIELLRQMLEAGRTGEALDEDETQRAISNFTTWVAVFGSDEGIETFKQWMQAAFHGAPSMIAVRLYTEFVLAARRDIGNPDTQLTAVDVAALRLNDVYDNPKAYAALTLPLDELARRENWELPWEQIPT